MSESPPQTLPEQAIILAAGKGERLKPYTEKLPKPLLTFQNQTPLESVLFALQNAKVVNVCIVVNHLASKIKAHIGNGNRWGLKITYIHQEQTRGTADALRAATGFIKGPTYIMAADYILPPNFILEIGQAYLNQLSPLFFSLKELSDDELSRKSSVRFDSNGRIVELVEKPEPGKAPSKLAASLFFIAPTEIHPYLSDLTLSNRGEFEIADVVNRMIQDDFSINWLLQPEPIEITLETMDQ